MRWILRGVDDDVGTGLHGDAPKEGTENRVISVEGPRKSPRPDRTDDARQIPVAVDPHLQVDHLVGIERAPTAERALPDRQPERAGGEVLAATAKDVVDKTALPEV